MCGIVGWLNVEVAPDVAERTLGQMCASIEYRGPDDYGMFFDHGVALGMRRLSIVDIAGGHQPMSSEDGSLQLVFNGEIYNHDELRRQLICRGVQFKSRSDTEVILRTYELDGLEGFRSFNGMFAIALWDGRSKILHLVRDRLGVKPLYYAVDGTKVVFASEIKAILASGFIGRELNARAMWDFMTYRYVPAPETIWSKVFKLKPGHWLSLKCGEAVGEPSRWWDVPADLGVSFDKDEEAVDEFSVLFENAVDLRMVADVPVGILLSGGLDSSAVAAAAARKSARIETFSVAFDGAADIDERSYARAVAGHLGTKHHEIVIGCNEFIDFLPRFTHLTDEPLADLASIPLYHVNRLAGRSVKVVLSGEGSDEIFGGYTFDWWVSRWDEARKVSPLNASNRLTGWIRRMLPALFGSRQALLPIETDLRRLSEPLVMTNLASSAEKSRWFRRPIAAFDSLQRVRDNLSRRGNQDPLNQALYIYCQDWLVEDLLMKADRMSMANSIELRTPFLDYRLVEWAFRLAPRLKVGRDEAGRYATKLILRKYARSWLPAAVIERPKMGFPVPVYGWLSDQLSDWAREVLGAGARVRTWLHDEAIGELVSAGTAPNATSQARHRLWNVLVLEYWMQSWKA